MSKVKKPSFQNFWPASHMFEMLLEEVKDDKIEAYSIRPSTLDKTAKVDNRVMEVTPTAVENRSSSENPPKE
ncbi:hypothetical protein TNCV_392711 [Trichonephila clavipes]|nr:hypothetical protein TNCV_392711 [Trichonephila clavipes]